MEGNCEQFEPSQELLDALLSMGIAESIAHEALFCTGNNSIEAAVNYVFNNLPQSQPDVGPVVAGVESDSDGEENRKNYKMTFVVNTALKMGVGKIAAQVGHACLGLYREMKISGEKDEALNEWDYNGEKKIVLKGINADHLQELFNKAKELNIPCYLVSDAGHTQIPSGSITVLSVFGDEEEANSITGGLGLL